MLNENKLLFVCEIHLLLTSRKVESLNRNDIIVLFFLNC